MEMALCAPTRQSQERFMSTKNTDGNISVLTRQNCAQVFFVYGGKQGMIEGMGPMTFLQRSGLADRNIVFIRDPRANFFESGVSADIPDCEAVLDWHSGYLAENPHITDVYTVGNSFGGWGALFFGYMLAVDKVWAMAPAGAWGRDLLVDLMADSNGKTVYDIYYSHQLELDKIFAESLQHTPGVSLVHVKEHGHLMMSGLMRTGVLPTLFPPFKASAG